MDIRYLEYFVEIVNCKFNLSAASKKLKVSQPALSQIIKSFETGENIQLFERYKGRLQNLTPSGKVFYRNALLLTENYRNMLDELRESSIKVRGKVRIGIPPLILGITFSEILSIIISDNPDVEIEITEAGSVELEQMLLSNSLDLAVLVQPTSIDSELVDEHLIQESELSAFMSIDNPLVKKRRLIWGDLNNQTLALQDSSFALHHKIKTRLEREDVQLKKIITSKSWDFLLMSTKRSSFVTIFQTPISDIFSLDGIVAVPFVDPIPWKVAICQVRKKRHTQVEKFVLKTIVAHFSSNGEAAAVGGNGR